MLPYLLTEASGPVALTPFTTVVGTTIIHLVQIVTRNVPPTPDVNNRVFNAVDEGLLSCEDNSVSETFVFAYLQNRAVAHESKETLTIRERRNHDYLENLVALIRKVSGDRVELDEQYITISADAARNLGTVR